MHASPNTETTTPFIYTFPLRSTSAVMTASISSAPSANIINAEPFVGAILKFKDNLVPRALSSSKLF